MITHSTHYAAERLLSTIQQDPERPFFTEEALLRKIWRDYARANKIRVRSGLEGYHLLVQNEWNAIVRLAGLTCGQEEVLRLRLRGWTYEGIGAMRGHSKQGSLNVFHQAVKKLAKARKQYAYTGMADTYLAMTRVRAERRR